MRAAARGGARSRRPTSRRATGARSVVTTCPAPSRRQFRQMRRRYIVGATNPGKDAGVEARREADPDRCDFAAWWAEAGSIKGWLTEAQAARLWQEAAELPPGSTVIEIGSHQG